MFYKINKQNFNNIDFIKVCMSILVVATHTDLFSIIEKENIRELIIAALAFKVPFFFTASGFLIYYKVVNASYIEKMDRLRFWIKKTLRLYVLWTMVYLPFTIYGLWNSDYGLVKSIFVFIRNVVFVGQNYLSWPLWYLLGTLVAGIILYVLFKYKVKSSFLYILAICMALLGVLIDYCHEHQIMNLYIDKYYSVFQTTRNGLFQGFPYIVIGMFIAEYGLVRLNILYCIFIPNFVLHMFGVKFATFIMIYALFSIIIQHDFKDRKDNLYLNFRLTNTVVYFTHMIWVGILLLLSPISLSPMSLFLITVFCSLLIANIVIKNKGNKIIKLFFR